MFIVVWTTKSIHGEYRDHYLVFDNEPEALRQYRSCIENNAWSVSMCSPTKSTDYGSDRLIDWVKRLGQWHLANPNESVTRCGRPMLGNNYAGSIPVSDRGFCSDCWGGE